MYFILDTMYSNVMYMYLRCTNSLSASFLSHSHLSLSYLPLFLCIYISESTWNVPDNQIHVSNMIHMYLQNTNSFTYFSPYVFIFQKVIHMYPGYTYSLAHVSPYVFIFQNVCDL